MNIHIVNVLFLHLTFLGVSFALPISNVTETEVSVNNNTIFIKKTTLTKLKSQTGKVPKQDEEDGGGEGGGGIGGYTGGLVDRLMGFGQSILTDDINLGKVFAGAAAFIPGEAGANIGSIFENIAKPFNTLVEKPIQKVQELILGGTANLLNANTTNAPAQQNTVPNVPAPSNTHSAVQTSNSQVILTPNVQVPATVLTNDPSKSTIHTENGNPNAIKSSSQHLPVISQAPLSVAPPVNNYQQPPIVPNENRPAPANEINSEEEDGDDGDEEDADIAKA